MSLRNLSYEQIHNQIWPGLDRSPSSRAASHARPCPAARAQRADTLPWPIFLLLGIIAVIGEIAAIALASVLHLGPAATALAFAGVVLASMWPLVRSAI
jgi:hypothetical protein